MVKLPIRKLLDKWDEEQRKLWLRRLCLLLGVAFLLTFFLEYRYFVNNVTDAWNFVTERPLVYLFNSFLMFLILAFFTALFNKPFRSIFFTTMMIIIITYIHISKFELRGTPLLPEDFQLASEASSLTKFVAWGSIIKLIIAILLVFCACKILDKLTSHFFGIPEKRQKGLEKVWWKRSETYLRLLVMTISLIAFLTSTDFIRHHNGQRYQEIPFLHSELVAWNQVRNYDYNGFIVGFLYNWNKYDLAEPAGYSEEKITEIADEYNKEKAEEDQTRTSLQDTDYNIVIVLNESFYDAEIIKSYYNYGDKDVTPNLHRITRKYPSGLMYSLDYGGGTANIEFEVLTGLSNYWANTVPYTDLLPKTGEVPSIANFAKENGYTTTAIHPFNGGMYKRNIALKNEGFDTFITETEMDFTEHEGDGNLSSQYINDRSAYNQVLKTLNDSSDKQLITLITMQNHTPYDEDIYQNLEFRIPEYEEEDWWREWRIATYLQLMHKSDQYLGEFIDSLDHSDEKTVVLFFGDHSPGIFDKVNYHEDKAVRDLSRMTPYFIYANFDLGDAERNLPMTTPNCLSNTLLNTLNVKKPSLDYLLDQVCTETPILTPNYWGDQAPFQSTALSNYELVNYDILGGKKYWMSLTNN